VRATLHPASKNVPMLPDGTQLPAAAALRPNQAIPLKFESEAQP